MRNNPLLELIAEKERTSQFIRDVPSLIDEQVGEHIEKLEKRLLRDFQELSERALDESATLLSEQLEDRINTLEKVSAGQSRSLLNLRDSSLIAERKVSAVVEGIEQTLARVAPGFQLPPSAHPQFRLNPGTDLVKAESREISETCSQLGSCPKCTSRNVRRANRSGLFEGFLRLFFITPFRCRGCRHKFYRF